MSIGGVDDEVTIRFTTDNPGPWFFHCHIDWHLAGGLAVVFAEASEDVAQNEPANSEFGFFFFSRVLFYIWRDD